VLQQKLKAPDSKRRILDERKSFTQKVLQDSFTTSKLVLNQQIKNENNQPLKLEISKSAKINTKRYNRNVAILEKKKKRACEVYRFIVTWNLGFERSSNSSSTWRRQ